MRGNPNSTYFSLPVNSSKSSIKHQFALNPYERHKELVRNYQLLKTTENAKPKSDLEVLHENHQFIHQEDDQLDTYETRLAKKYYEKLFKEYCLGDFSKYKTGAIGLRWRTKQECIDAKGQFICGNLKCDRDESLSSWEVNFAYMEQGKKKNALVKIRLCLRCSDKLNYKKIMKRPAEREESSLVHKKRVRVDEEEEDRIISNEQEADSDSEEESGGNVWAIPIKEEDLQGQKSKEEEMEEFLNEMFQ